jgi:hypothetical protein
LGTRPVNKYGEATRSADVYVFCLYTEKNKAKANVLEVAAWDFFVVSTATLNQEFRTAKSISLAALKRLAVACKFEGLKVAVDGATRARTAEKCE